MAKMLFRFITFCAVFILTWIVLPTPFTVAACLPNSTAGNTIPCNVNGTQYYCASVAECDTLKGNTSGSTTGTTVREGFKPEECNGNGIMTALGCLPYKTEGSEFSSALFTLLAGIAGGISLVIMLIATIQIMTAGDNAEQVKKGKELFTGAVTGLLFIIFSVTLLKLVAGDIIKLPGF